MVSDPGSEDMGRLHISQWSLDCAWDVEVAGGCERASDVGGAEFVLRDGAGISLSVGVLGDVLVFSFLSTIERYVSAILGPDGIDGRAGFIVLSSCSDDRTKGTRFRRIPAPKTRWSCSGR